VAVVLATVVVAVSALILHTQRRLHRGHDGGGTADGRHTANGGAGGGGYASSQRHSDVEQVLAQLST